MPNGAGTTRRRRHAGLTSSLKISQRRTEESGNRNAQTLGLPPLHPPASLTLPPRRASRACASEGGGAFSDCAVVRCKLVSRLRRILDVTLLLLCVAAVVLWIRSVN